MRWIRLNIDFDDSPWLFNLSAEIQLAWIKLLCHVKRDGVKGRCRALMPMVAAKKWGVSQTVVERLIEAAEQANALDIEDGVWVVLNWDKYQTSDPTGAERSARYRGRKRPSDEEFESENECVTRDFPVTCHATETKTSTKTKTKKERQAKKDFLAETPASGATPFGGSRRLSADAGGGVPVVGYGIERGTLTFVNRHLSIEGHSHATPLGVSLSLGETVGVGLPLKSTGTFRLATLVFPCLWGNGKRELFRGEERGRRKLAALLEPQNGNYSFGRGEVDFPHPSSDTSQPPPSPSSLGEGIYPSIPIPSSRFLAFGATNRKGSSPRRKGAWVPSPGWRDSLHYPPYGGAVSGTNRRGFDKTDFPSELGEGVCPSTLGPSLRERKGDSSFSNREIAPILTFGTLPTSPGSILSPTSPRRRGEVDFPLPSSDTSQPPPSPSELGEGIFPSTPGPSSRCEEGKEAHMNQFLAVFHERRRSLGCDLLGVAHG